MSDLYSPDDWSDYVHSYSTNIMDEYGVSPSSLDPDTLYFGVEIENQYNTSSRYGFDNIAKSLLDHFCGKSTKVLLTADGSIEGSSCSGAELVTTPQRVEVLLEDFKGFWEANGSDLISSSCCGMHVHVSRAPLAILTIAKLLIFLNMEENKDEIVKIAGRSGSSYASYKKKELTDALKSHHERYEVLNLIPKHTIEFRLFASPTSYEEFATRIQFVYAAIKFVQSTHYERLSFDVFRQFVTTKLHSHKSFLVNHLNNN